MYLAAMSTTRAVTFLSLICLLVSCGGSSTGGRGGSGGSIGGASGGTGAAGRGGGGGATGAGGGGGALADCPGCVTCVTTSCASQVATCQANVACNAVYECGRTCTTPFGTCVTMHLDALATWGTVQSCITANCATICGL